MINVETLRKPPPSPKEKTLPIRRKEIVRDLLHEKIEDICQKVEKPIRLSYPHGYHSLFDVNAGDKYSRVYGLEKPGIKTKASRVETKSIQGLAFEVMKTYGFNENFSVPETRWGLYPKGIFHYGNGTSRESLLFPSQTIPGLVFRRIRDFYDDNGETISFAWDVCDVAPSNRVSFKKIFQRKTSHAGTSS